MPPLPGLNSTAYCHLPTAYCLLSQIVFREADAFGLGVEAREHLLDEACLDAAGLARLDEIANGRVNPGVLVDAEDDRRVLAHLQLIDGRLREQLAVGAYALAHRLQLIDGRLREQLAVGAY